MECVSNDRLWSAQHDPSQPTGSQLREFVEKVHEIMLRFEIVPILTFVQAIHEDECVRCSSRSGNLKQQIAEGCSGPGHTAGAPVVE